MGASVHTIKKSTETLVVASKEIGLDVNADKSKYMFMSRNQNAGSSGKTKIVSSSFERMKDFAYLGTTLTNQNYTQEEIKSKKVRECLLSFDAESFAIQFAIQKYKDMLNYNFTCCFVWV